MDGNGKCIIMNGSSDIGRNNDFLLHNAFLCAYCSFILTRNMYDNWIGVWVPSKRFFNTESHTQGGGHSFVARNHAPFRINQLTHSSSVYLMRITISVYGRNNLNGL